MTNCNQALKNYLWIRTRHLIDDASFSKLTDLIDAKSRTQLWTWAKDHSTDNILYHAGLLAYYVASTEESSEEACVEHYVVTCGYFAEKNPGTTLAAIPHDNHSMAKLLAYESIVKFLYKS